MSLPHVDVHAKFCHCIQRSAGKIRPTFHGHSRSSTMTDRSSTSDFLLVIHSTHSKR